MFATAKLLRESGEDYRGELCEALVECGDKFSSAGFGVIRQPGQSS